MTYTLQANFCKTEAGDPSFQLLTRVHVPIFLGLTPFQTSFLTSSLWFLTYSNVKEYLLLGTLLVISTNLGAFHARALQ